MFYRLLVSALFTSHHKTFFFIKTVQWNLIACFYSGTLAHVANESFLATFTKLRKVTISFVMFVCLSVCSSTWNNLASTEQIYMTDIWYLSIFQKYVQIIQFH